MLSSVTLRVVGRGSIYELCDGLGERCAQQEQDESRRSHQKKMASLIFVYKRPALHCHVNFKCNLLNLIIIRLVVPDDDTESE
jgi:hypothetical protein